MNADYIIVGAGSAGCVLANRLTEDPKISVILLEAGGEDWNPLIHIPAGYIKTMVNPAMNWMFTTKPDPRTGNREIAIPRGKVLGGSSAINAMLYVRGQAADYDLWAQKGNTGWSYDDVLPYFKKSEDCQIDTLQDDTQHRAKGGPLAVAALRNTYPVLDRLRKAAAVCGYPENPDYNGATQEGFGYYQVTQKHGLRFSAKKAYLQPARRRPNLTVITGAMATGLTFDAQDAKNITGVRYSKANQPHEVTANHEVLLAAGAIQSPQLLELSGIGQPDHLNRLGITPRHALNGVGENLSDHYISRLSWRLNENLSLNHTSRGLPLLGQIIRFALTRRGTLSMPAGMLSGFVRSNETTATPDVQFHIGNASFSNPAKRVFHKFPGLTIGPCQLRPLSRGTVHIQSSNPTTHPEICPEFLAHPTDQQIHVKAMRIARDLMATDLMRSLVVEELTPGSPATTDEELLTYALETGVTLYHPVSTCRMGPQAANGDVVDARLRLHGMRGLRVVDASIMPELISGNTNAPTMMIAEKAADMIREDHKATTY